MSDDFQGRGGSPWGTPPGGGDGNGSGRGPRPPDIEAIISIKTGIEKYSRFLLILNSERVVNNLFIASTATKTAIKT